jgi:hypothetical protein
MKTLEAQRRGLTGPRSLSKVLGRVRPEDQHSSIYPHCSHICRFSVPTNCCPCMKDLPWAKSWLCAQQTLSHVTHKWPHCSLELRKGRARTQKFWTPGWPLHPLHLSISRCTRSHHQSPQPPLPLASKSPKA